LKQTFYTYNVFFSVNHEVCEIRCKNIVEPNMPKITIWRMDSAW